MSDDLIWTKITDSLMTMNDEEYLIAISELQNLVSIAICDRLDVIESQIKSYSEAQSIINKF